MVELALGNTDYASTIFPTKITAEQNEVALSYHKLRWLCFLAVIFVTTIVVS